MLHSQTIRYAALVACAAASISCDALVDSTSPTGGGTALSPLTRTVSTSFAYLSAESLSAEARGTAVRWGPSHDDGEQRVSAVVGPEGGLFSLPGSDFTMSIPEGALTTPTLISVTSKGGPHVAYDMQPHGLVFLKPVTVVQQLRNTASYGTPELDGIRSAYLSDGNEEIQPDDSASPSELSAGETIYSSSGGAAETHLWYLHHFSRYILISGVWTLIEE